MNLWLEIAVDQDFYDVLSVIDSIEMLSIRDNVDWDNNFTFFSNDWW